MHTIEVEISLEEHPEIKEVATVTVTVDPCQVTNIDGSVLEAPLSYSVDTPATVGGIYSFV